MALVIKTDTREFSPVYNNMEVCVLQDDPATRALPDYKYIFDVRIVDYISMLSLSVRFKVSPNPRFEYAIQLISPAIEAFIKETFVPFDDTSSFRLTDNAIINYRVEYGEEYRLTADDPIVEYPNILQGDFKWAWGGSLETHRFIDFYNTSEYENYLIESSAIPNRQFLTNNKTPKVKIGDLGWTWLMTSSPNDVDYLEVKTYDSVGALITTFKINNVTDKGIDRSHLMSLATSPQSLNNITPGSFLIGAQPVITSSVKTYTIEVFIDPSTSISETLTFTIQDDCFYETYRLHFENEYGGFDAFNFNLRNRDSADGTKKFYKNNAPNLNADGIVYQNQYETKVNYHSKFTNKASLISEYLTEAENDWLKELAFSPQVYLEFTNSSGVRDFKPCLIRGAKWEENKTTIDKLFDFKVEIELADNYRQRR